MADKSKVFSGETIRLGILKNILSASSSNAVRLGVSGMDDAAVIDINSEQQLVIASDFVRGSEFYLFQLGHINYFDIGYYLIAANLSDIAAMGVLPSGLLTVIRYGKEMDDGAFADVFYGMQAASRDYSTPIVGGDIGGYVADVFSATAFGFTARSNYLRRSTAKVGDILCISGPIGGAIGALTYCKEIKLKSPVLNDREENELLDKWRRPKARIDVGRLLLTKALASSCMDISDGLKASIDQLAQSSKLGFRVQQKSIPVHPILTKLCSLVGLDEIAIATSASVDFELLFTIPRARLDVARHEFALANHNLFEIGEAVEDASIREMVSLDGQSGHLPGIPWDHQKGDHVAAILRDSLSRNLLKN